jgi:hypothetical protein
MRWGSGGRWRMRSALEIVLLLGGAFGLALGLDGPLRTGMTSGQNLALAGCGAVAALLGIALSFGRGAKAAAARPETGPVGVAVLGLEKSRPIVLSRDAGLDVFADPDGIVRFRLKYGRRARRLVCRASGPAYFNSLKQDRREAAIKLIGPLAGPCGSSCGKPKSRKALEQAHREPGGRPEDRAPIKLPGRPLHDLPACRIGHDLACQRRQAQLPA